MKKYIGHLILMLVIAFPAVSFAQPFETCEDAENFGQNTAHLMVGQTYARMDCRSRDLAGSVDALVRATSELVASFGGPDEHKVCYYQGIYRGIIDRLRLEHDRCNQPWDFPPVTLDTVARFAVATFSAMTQALPLPLLSPATVRRVFSLDHRFLEGDEDFDRCTDVLIEKENAMLGARGAARFRRPLRELERKICGQAADAAHRGTINHKQSLKGEER